MEGESTFQVENGIENKERESTVRDKKINGNEKIEENSQRKVIAKN